MQDFLTNNWLTILSTLIGMAVAYVFYRLQKKDSASASAERKKHANAELLDVIESYIINKQELTESVIDNLIHASERHHSVVLRPLCTAISLLQDVALRLQRSRHLDIPQKSEYSVKIDALITEARARAQPLTWEELSAESQETINEVVELVPEDRRIDVRSKLEYLGAMGVLTSNHGELLGKLDSKGSKLSLVSAVTAGLAASLLASRVGTNLLLDVNEKTGFLFERLMPVFTAAMTLVIVGGAVILLVITLRARGKRA